MEEKIRVRKATMADLAALLRFEQGVIEAERPYDATLKDGTIHYYDIEALLLDEQTEVAIAETDDVIVASGYATIEPAKPFLKYDRHAYLGFMYVLPAHRGKRINRMIIDWLTDFAAAHGITELRLEVYAGNEQAIRAYEKAGFASLIVTMRKGV